MKCRRCKEPAVIEIRRHNAGFCRDCFFRHLEGQVERANHDFAMYAPGDRVLVAVSGGKDSLGLWDLLLRAGVDAAGVYLGLGIGDYSDESGRLCHAFAEQRDAVLHHVDIRGEYGFDIPGGAAAARRAPCAACGLSKRYLFNRVASEHGYDVVATGHNLDDEAAVLFGNVLHWSVDYILRQGPVLPAEPGFVKKVKPLVRIGEREMAAYCVLRGIDYIVEECPMVAGNTGLRYKETLNALEDQSPGTKASFYLGYLERAAPVLRAGADARGANPDSVALVACGECGSPTMQPDDGSTPFCAFCRLRARAAPVAVEVEVAPADSDG
jgi:tRNA(Ile)-lysidine synthase TilS/MesJ